MLSRDDVFSIDSEKVCGVGYIESVIGAYNGLICEAAVYYVFPSYASIRLQSTFDYCSSHVI